MANKIQQRRGLKSSIPTLSSGELGYTTDTRELFIGTGSGNVNVGGSHWYRGTAMSGTSTATNTYSYSACPQVKLDDIYLNTSNGNIYVCTTAGSGSSAKWTYQGCIKGPQGATGAKGTKGDAGQDLQAVYSSTPTVVGTWVDGKPIYRVAWSFTKAQNSQNYMPYPAEVTGCPAYNDVDGADIIRQSYTIRCDSSDDSTYVSTKKLQEELEKFKTTNSNYTVYCIIEYIK